MAEVRPDEATRLDDRKRAFLRGALPPGIRDAVSGLLGAPAEASEPSMSFRRYEIHEKVGEGGMAVVYRATDRELGREVALKVMRKSLDLTETGRKRFLREALVGARLSHPNLVTLHDAGEEAGWTFLVMELVKGEPLSRVLAGRRHETRPMLALLEKAARAVHAAHLQGVVHRDLKPANILVTAAGEPKVADFGLAHLTDADAAMTKTGAMMGTPSYMAPEQLRGGPDRILPTTDVYALGSILYEILTGRPPHTGDSTLEIYAKLQSEEPLPPRRINSRAHPELETICLKALERDPQRRYPTAAAFADDLRRHLDGHSILARPAGPASRILKWTRRNRVASSVALMALLGAAAVSVVMLLNAARGREDRRREVERLLADGRRAQAERRKGEEDLAAFRERQTRLEAEIPPEAPEERKQPLWDLQEQIEAAEFRVADLQARMLSAFSQAVGRDPDCAEARRFLAGFYLSEYVKAGEQGDPIRAAEAAQYVRLHDPGGRAAAALDAGGSITFESEPAGAEVFLFSHVKANDRRLVPRPWPPRDGAPDYSGSNRLGACPVASGTLPPGSYLAVLRLKGYRDVRYPFLVERNRALSARVPLYTEAEIGGDFVYVPPGPFIRGGDPSASPRRAREQLDLEGFFIGRHELTCEEYNEFISGLIQEQGMEAAQKRLPRKLPDGAYLWTMPPGADSYRVRPESLKWPIIFISHQDAEAYCAWRTARGRARGEARTYRLPSGDEWEKTARGADGRVFPWGNSFDWSFARSVRSTVTESGGPRSFDNVGSHPKDCSPYGVFDLSGSFAEWCGSWFDESLHMKQNRGGTATFSSPDTYRVTVVRGATPETVGVALTFRIAADLPRR